MICMVVDKEGFVAFKNDNVYVIVLVIIITKSRLGNISFHARSTCGTSTHIWLRQQCDIVEQSVISVFMSHIIFGKIT